MKEDLRKQPRWLQKIRAFLGGYFWRPCPLCGEYFGGHEWGDNCVLMTGVNEGKGVCNNCRKKADKLNRKNFPNYFKSNK